jgi:hypothetical protein
MQLIHHHNMFEGERVTVIDPAELVFINSALVGGVAQ